MKTLKPPQSGDALFDKDMSDFAKRIDGELRQRTPDNQVRRELYLSADDGSVWQVTVSSLGALSTTKVRDA